MQTETLIYIILSGIVALLIALFQYLNKKKSMSKLNMLFSFLRFISVFAALLLIINPSFKQVSLSIEKPNLVVVVDNSSSISYLNYAEPSLDVVKRLKENPDLKAKFNLDFYTFGNTLKPYDSLDFSENQTNISSAFKQLSQVYKKQIAPTVLITDGNQTYGDDYRFASKGYPQTVFPVILGDTITYTDLKIQELNVNRYAFLKNSFPVEVILVYNGNKKVNSEFRVTQGNTVVYSKPISFSKTNNAIVVNFTLPANRVGVTNYKATIQPLVNEKNEINNSRNFAIEVINQKTHVAIVTDIMHPDIGMLKKSIEHNEQRFVEVVEPNNVIRKINDFQLFILYQPNNKFNKVFNALNTQNSNIFTIIGTKTDLSFLNKVSNNYNLDITNQSESYQAELNSNYAPFRIEDINFETFPPLLSNYGDIQFSKPYDPILNKTLNGISTNQPLLVSTETEGKREVILFGEHIWKWRAQSYLNTNSFNEFDDFIGRLVQYLASNKKKSRLNIDYNSFYDGTDNVTIKAAFFDKNYSFDSRETLNIRVINEESKEEKTFPLILKNSHFEVDLSGLPPAKYSFTVKASGENISKSGTFEILEYNVEHQFLNADVTKLKQMASNRAGQYYFISDTKSMIDDLLKDSRFVPIQKSTKKSIPLIDWKYLLALIAFSLSLEWILRKYNGLI